MIDCELQIDVPGDRTITIAAKRQCDASAWAASRIVGPDYMQVDGFYVWTITHIETGLALRSAHNALCEAEACALALYLDSIVGKHREGETLDAYRARTAEALLAYDQQTDCLYPEARRRLKKIAKGARP